MSAVEARIWIAVIVLVLLVLGFFWLIENASDEFFNRFEPVIGLIICLAAYVVTPIGTAFALGWLLVRAF